MIVVARRKRSVTQFVQQSTAFINGLAEGCGVDAAQARLLWDEFARGMSHPQRIDFMLNGHQGGLEAAKIIQKANETSKRS